MFQWPFSLHRAEIDSTELDIQNPRMQTSSASLPRGTTLDPLTTSTFTGGAQETIAKMIMLETVVQQRMISTSLRVHNGKEDCGHPRFPHDLFSSPISLKPLQQVYVAVLPKSVVVTVPFPMFPGCGQSVVALEYKNTRFNYFQVQKIISLI